MTDLKPLNNSLSNVRTSKFNSFPATANLVVYDLHWFSVIFRFRIVHPAILNTLMAILDGPVWEQAIEMIQASVTLTMRSSIRSSWLTLVSMNEQDGQDSHLSHGSNQPNPLRTNALYYSTSIWFGPFTCGADVLIKRCKNIRSHP